MRLSSACVNNARANCSSPLAATSVSGRVQGKQVGLTPRFSEEPNDVADPFNRLSAFGHLPVGRYRLADLSQLIYRSADSLAKLSSAPSSSL